MTFSDLEKIAILLYGSHWKQQIISEFNGKPSMINNWKRQGVPDYVKDKLVFIADERLVDVCEARSVLKRTDE